MVEMAAFGRHFFMDKKKIRKFQIKTLVVKDFFHTFANPNKG